MPMNKDEQNVACTLYAGVALHALLSSGEARDWNSQTIATITWDIARDVMAEGVKRGHIKTEKKP